MCRQYNFQDKNHSKKWDVLTYIVHIYVDSSDLKNLNHIFNTAKGVNRTLKIKSG